MSLSGRYITDRCFPDKAIDVIDEAGARVKLRQVSSTTLAAQGRRPRSAAVVAR